MNKIKGIHLCKRVSLLLLGGRGQPSLLQRLLAPLSQLLLHRHPLCSCSSTSVAGLLNVSPPFAGLSGGCDISDSLHGAPGAAHPLWMGALLDSGQPLPQPFCSQPSLPGLPVSDTTLYLQGGRSIAAWGWHEPPWEAELCAVICPQDTCRQKSLYLMIKEEVGTAGDDARRQR